MRAMPPHVDVPGDNAEEIVLPNGATLRPHIMGRTGEMLGMNAEVAVWRFGFSSGSEAANAYGVSLPKGEPYVWVLATRKTGKVKETYHGWAWLHLPANFNRIIDGGA